MLHLKKPPEQTESVHPDWQATCEGEPGRAADCRAVLDVNQCVMRATCSEERNTGGIRSPAPETLTLMTVCSHVELPAQTHPQFIAFAFRYYVCVFFVLIRLCRVASEGINSSSPQGHQSRAHPLSCCSLCHPPSTA